MILGNIDVWLICTNIKIQPLSPPIRRQKEQPSVATPFEPNVKWNATYIHSRSKQPKSTLAMLMLYH